MSDENTVRIAPRGTLRHRHGRTFYGTDGGFGPSRLPSNPACVVFVVHVGGDGVRAGGAVGVGDGRVVLGCALFRPRAKVRGYDLNDAVVRKARDSLRRIREDFSTRHPDCDMGTIEIATADILELAPEDFQDVTHATCMWTGMPMETQCGFLRLAARLPNLVSVAMPYHHRFRDLPSETHRTGMAFGRTRGTLLVHKVDNDFKSYVAQL